jgi:hypothetical protein
VLVPANLKTKEQVDVLLHLHGHGIGFRRPGGSGAARDETIDKTESQLEDSKRNMIAVLPQGNYRSNFGEFDSDDYLTKVFAKLTATPRPPDGKQMVLPSGKTPGRVVLSAHSGGGNTVVRMLNEPGRSRLPATMAELVLFDGLHGKSYDVVNTWLQEKLDHDLTELTNSKRKGNEKEQRTYLATSPRFRGYHTATAGKGYSRTYKPVDDFLTKWFADNEAALGGQNTLAYQGLRHNYKVVTTGLGPGDHENIMGKYRGFKDALTVVDAVPPTPAGQGQAPNRAP